MIEMFRKLWQHSPGIQMFFRSRSKETDCFLCVLSILCLFACVDQEKVRVFRDKMFALSTKICPEEI